MKSERLDLGCIGLGMEGLGSMSADYMVTIHLSGAPKPVGNHFHNMVAICLSSDGKPVVKLLS